MQMEKKNDLVKYNNIMNQIAFTKFTTTDYNFLMMLCSKLRNQETNKMVFSFKEIKELVNYRSNHTAEHFAMELKRMNQKMKFLCLSFSQHLRSAKKSRLSP